MLDKIIRYLRPYDRASLLRTCWQFHDISAHRLYRVMSVSRISAQLFLKTVSKSTAHYRNYLRSFQYITTCSADILLTYFIFSTAIPRLPGLVSLFFNVQPQCSGFLTRLVTGNQPVIAQLPNLGTLPLEQTILPNLRTFTLQGDMSLLDIIRERNITSLYITHMMDTNDLHGLMDTLTGVNTTNQTLQNLAVTFASKVCTTEAFRILGSIFVGLCQLFIRSPTIYALVCLEFETLHKTTKHTYILVHNSSPDLIYK